MPVAAPSAKSVMQSAIDILGIDEKEDGMMKEYNYGDKKYYIVNDVVGYSSKDAVKELKPFKVEFSGSGNKVLYQSPKAGSILYEGDIVRLMLGDE